MDPSSLFAQIRCAEVSVLPCVLVAPPSRQGASYVSELISSWRLVNSSS